MAVDRDDFECLVREHGPGLLKTAVLLTGNRDEAEDLLQEALEVCFRRWPAHGVVFPKAYVRTCMVRLCQRRRLTRRLWLQRNLDLVEVPGADASAEHADRHELLWALRQIPSRQRAAVVLRHWEGLTEAEKAEALGCSVGTVKSQTARGLAKLRGLYEHPSPGPAGRRAVWAAGMNGAQR